MQTVQQPDAQTQRLRAYILVSSPLGNTGHHLNLSEPISSGKKVTSKIGPAVSIEIIHVNHFRFSELKHPSTGPSRTEVSQCGRGWDSDLQNFMAGHLRKMGFLSY